MPLFSCHEESQTTRTTGIFQGFPLATPTQSTSQHKENAMRKPDNAKRKERRKLLRARRAEGRIRTHHYQAHRHYKDLRRRLHDDELDAQVSDLVAGHG